MMKLKWISILLINIIGLYCNAQVENFKYFYTLDSISTAGFYAIKLSPEIKAHLKLDLSDIRIVNNDGRWVPHILSSTKGKAIVKEQVINQSFLIKQNDKKSTVITIGPIQNIVADMGLVIKNTAANRFCTLSGSEDNKNWFVINDSILLDPGSDEKLTSKTLRITFPPSSYAYFKITIANNNKDPFNIKGVVFYQTSAIKEPNNLIENPATTITVKDIGKISYLKVTQQNLYHFTSIHIKINAPKFYNRSVSLYLPAAGSMAFNDNAILLQNFTISNNSSGLFTLPLSNAGIFYLLINNEDNLPLNITEVSTASDFTYLTTYLENGNGYKLIIDNATASTPNFDLNSFTNISPDSIQFLSSGKIKKSAEKIIVKQVVKNQQWLIWAALISGLILLILFTSKMVKEVNKKEQDDSI